MRLSRYLSLIFLLSAASAAPVAFEAGFSYVALGDAKYETNPDPLLLREDKNAWSPYVGARVELSKRVAARLGYQHMGNLRTHAVYSAPPGPGPVKPQVVVPARYESDVHIASLGPQFQHALSPRIQAFITPEANWVFERGNVSYFSSAPVERNKHTITLGCSAGFRYNSQRRWSAEIGYRYIDARPSWDRKAHALTLGVSFR